MIRQIATAIGWLSIGFFAMMGVSALDDYMRPKCGPGEVPVWGGSWYCVVGRKP